MSRKSRNSETCCTGKWPDARGPGNRDMGVLQPDVKLRILKIERKDGQDLAKLNDKLDDTGIGERVIAQAVVE